MHDRKVVEAILDEICNEIPNIEDKENKYTLASIKELGGVEACYEEILRSAACLVKLMIDLNR